MAGKGIDALSPHWFRLNGNIHGLTFDRVNTIDVHPNRSLSEWVLVLISSGERTFRVYEEEYAIHSNEFFLLPPNVRHSGIRLDRHQAYFVHFSAEGTEVPIPTQIDTGSILLPLCGQIPTELHCLDLMDYIIRHRTPPFYNERFVATQVKAILYQLSLYMQKNTIWKKRDNVSAYKILKFIDDNKNQHLIEQDYEKAFGKSYRQLNSIFSRVYGMTIKQMQITLCISQARRMLSSGYTIAETGLACGFDDYFYFLKIFKKRTGMTPYEFQNIYK